MIEPIPLLNEATWDQLIKELQSRTRAYAFGCEREATLAVPDGESHELVYAAYYHGSPSWAEGIAARLHRMSQHHNDAHMSDDWEDEVGTNDEEEI